MSEFLQNILKKHTSVCGKNVFLPHRFLNENPDEENPESEEEKGKKDKDKDKKKKKDTEKEEVFQIDTKEIEKIIRGSIATVIASKINKENAKSALESDDIAQEIITAMERQTSVIFEKINGLLSSSPTNPVTKRQNYNKAMEEFGKAFGIPPSIQKTLMFEFETDKQVENHMENFKKFIEKIIREFIVSYREFLDLDSILEEDKKIFEKKVRTGESGDQKGPAVRERIKERLLSKFNQRSKGQQSEMHRQLHKAIQKTLDPLVDKACDKFGISENDPGVRETFKNGDPRTALLTKYGEYKDKEWEIKIFEEEGDSFSQRRVERMKVLQKDIEGDIETLKQEARINNAIEIYDLNNLESVNEDGKKTADLGGESIGERLLRNNRIISKSRKNISSLRQKIEDAEEIIRYAETGEREIKEEDLQKKKDEVSKYQKEIKAEEERVDSFQQEHDWILGKYKAEDINKGESERKDLALEMREYTREKAVDYLINEGGWLQKDYYGEDAIFSVEDIPHIKKILIGKEEGYVDILSDRQILEYFHKQKSYENNEVGERPVLEFHNSIKDCSETFTHFRLNNPLYEKFLKKHFGGEAPLDANNISSDQLGEFIETMFGSAECMTDPEDEGKKTRLKTLKNILLKYLVGEKSDSKYYDPSEHDELGKDDDNPNRPTIGEKGKEMLYKLLSSFADKSKSRMQAAEDMQEIVETEWNEGIYPCVLKYDAELQDLEEKHAAEEKGKKGYDPLKNLFGVGSAHIKNLFDWKMLNWYAVAEMFQTGFEGVRRYFNLKNETKAAEAGYILADYIPIFGERLKSEFLKTKQQKQDEEVNSRKESYTQYGYSELIDELHKAPDKFTIKAVLITLSDKGYLMRNDLLTDKAVKVFNKYLYTGMPIPKEIPDEMSSAEKDQYIDKIRTGVDKEWGQGSLDGWFSQSDSTRESNVQKNFTLIQKRSGPEKMRMFNDLMNLLFTDRDAFKKKYPIDIILGYIRQEMVEGNLDCDIHLTFLMILRMEGIIDDDHIEEMRVKHANDYPSYSILKWDEMKYSGMADIYKKARPPQGNLFSGGKLQEKHPIVQFFINRHKLPLKVKKNGNYWDIAETEEQKNEYETVSIFASDLHQRRAAHLEYVDNSNAPVYFRAYDPEEVIGTVFRLDNSGNMPNVKRGHDMTAMLAGSFYTPIFANILAAQEAREKGDKTNFMHQVRTAFYDLHSSYRMVEHLTQHAERKIPETDNSSGGVPYEDSRGKKIEKTSKVVGNSNLYFQNVVHSKVNRLDCMPLVKKVAEDVSGLKNKNANIVRRAVDNMFALHYPPTSDKKMLGFEPWKYYWQALHGMEALFQEIGGDMYEGEESAKKMIQSDSKSTEKGKEM